MKKLKRTLSLLLAFVIVTSVFTAVPLTVGAAESAETAEVGASSGTTGDCTWSLDDNGTLTISGNGAMANYSYYDTAPWGKEIKKVIIENGVTNIGEYVFYGCDGLTSVIIGNSITSICEEAFAWCENLTSLTIPNSVTSIGDSAFSYSGITKITIPQSVVSIGKSAFEWCGKLKSAVILSRIERINDGIFNYCENLTDVTIPNTVTEIGDYSFAQCTNLKSIEIPSGVKKIGIQSFSGSGLLRIDIPNSVTEIGYGAFRECEKLVEVNIPKSVVEIGDAVFYNTPWLEKLPDGLNYINDIAYYYKGNLPENSEIVFKDGTISVSNGLFQEQVNLCSVTIPNSVKSIGESAFRDCANLTEVIIPDSVTSIGTYAFKGCSNLGTIKHSANVEQMGYDVFDETLWLKNQPDGLIYIGKTLCTYKGEMPENTEITVREGTVGLASGALSAKENMVKVFLPDSVTNLGMGVFENNNDLKTVRLSNNLIEIPAFTFFSTESLEEIDLPAKISFIGNYAFLDTYNLKKTVIRNKDLVFGMGSYPGVGQGGVNSQMIVYGYIGSTAEKFAKEEGFTFKEIESEKTTGDINGDTVVDILDASLIQKFTVEKVTLTDEQKNTADVNADGMVDILDATDIQKFTVDKIPGFNK